MTHAVHRLRRPSRRRARRGITLVELLIAVLMLVVAVGGLVGTSAAVGRQMTGGISQTVAAGIAQARLDSLTSLSCAQLVGGSYGTSTSRGIAETWNVVDGRNTKTLNVRVTIPRRSTPMLYQMVIPCRE